MKFNLNSALLAVCCFLALSCPSCVWRTKRAATVTPANTPQPAPSSDAVGMAAGQPISVPQTQVTLPSPQPIQTEALTVVKPESPPAAPPSQAAKPQRAAPPKPQPPQQTTAQTTPAGPPPPPTSRRRIRPVESAAERQRLRNEISSRQRQTQEILAKARTRQLSDSEKNTADRIQA